MEQQAPESKKRQAEANDAPHNADPSKLPKKRYFRSRAHCNPLSYNDGFSYPLQPSLMDWSAHYPKINPENRTVTVLDIGMGFGGLTVELAKLLPDSLILGMEIRPKVCEYVRQRIEALRAQGPPDQQDYENCACLRTNCMRYLPNFFRKGQLEKIFICFPDPHFKAKNHRRRIVSHELLSEYAFFIKPGGKLYTCTDVEELHNWHVEKCDAHPYFARIDNAEAQRDDPAVTAMLEATEESKKVARLGGSKHFAVYERIADADEQCAKNPCILKLWQS